METQIRDLENQVLGLLKKVKSPYELVGIFGPNRVQEFIASDRSMVTDLDWFATNYEDEYGLLVEWAMEKVVARDAEKRAATAEKFENKTSNRALYLPYPVFKYYRGTKEDATAERWRYDLSLRSQGLLTLAVEEEFGKQEIPCSFNLVNLLPEEEDERGNMKQLEVPMEMWEHLVSEGVAVSGARLGWNMNSPAWTWLLKMFPKRIDLSAYNHSLNAPVLPGGFIKNCPVQVKVIRDQHGADLKTDGSGIYHPETKELQAITERYGLVPIQIRYINRQGVFAKGVLFPSEQSVDENGVPAITLDWLQIKGIWKAKAKENRQQDKQAVLNGYLGVIQVWKNPGVLQGGFELLENIQERPETRDIITRTLVKSFAKLKRKGIDGLVAKLTRDDESIKLIVQLVTLLKSMGVEIEATQIPRIREAVQEKLGHTLYHLAQGAGIEFDRFVCRLDSKVPPGKVVVRDFKPGTIVCGFRFPIVLSQGLVTLEVMKPLPHHTVNGEITKNMVIMNPRDLTVKMQGDDDGDILGLSADPDMVKLFSYLVDTNIYHIEPKGIEVLGSDGTPMKSDSPEGLSTLYQDQRGPVGLCTSLRSSLLACGRLAHANAVSLLIQESVDRAKRLPEWSDYRQAVSLHNWDNEADGYHFNRKLSNQFLDNGELDRRKLVKWVNSIIKDATHGRDITVLGWRKKKKRINPVDWAPCEVTEEVGGLVHWCHNEAYRLWQDLTGEFKLKTDKILELENLLPMVLDIKGHDWQLVVHSYEEYKQTLYDRSGLSDYTRQMAKNFSLRSHDEEENYNALAQEDLNKTFYETARKLTVNEQLTCWYWEAMNGNPNNCFRIVCFPGSKVLDLLELQSQDLCMYHHHVDGRNARLDLVMDWVLKGDEEPGVKLSKYIAQDKKHFKEVKDLNGEGVPLWQCHDCQEQLQTSLVNRIRSMKTLGERKVLGDLNNRFNMLYKR
jgi:hypothetical protein